MLCPDHIPRSEADSDGERQFSYCLGYIRALLQAADAVGAGAPVGAGAAA
jgi:hypothetical protein